MSEQLPGNLIGAGVLPVDLETRLLDEGVTFARYVAGPTRISPPILETWRRPPAHYARELARAVRGIEETVGLVATESESACNEPITALIAE